MSKKVYVQVKKVTAEPMTRAAYNKSRNWQHPINSDPDEEGYLVTDESGYTMWIPKKVFRATYREAEEGSLDNTIFSDDC